MPDLHRAEKNVSVVFDAHSRQPRIIVVDAEDVNDPAWNPFGCLRIAVPVHVYNASIVNPDPHRQVIEHAERSLR